MAHHHASNPAYQSLDSHQPWSPGWLVRCPWLGLGALVGSILSICAAIGVLIASNGRPITEWPIQPTVWLSVASTASNILLGYALTEGVTVSWWLRAMRPAGKLRDLHRNWTFGTSLWAAVTSGRTVNIIAIASILTAIAPITNPLLQRASRVTQGNLEVLTPVALTVPIAPALPRGFTGYISGRQYAASLYTANYTPVVQQYYSNNATKVGRDTGCQGSCKARLQGVGLSVNCSSYTVPFNLNPSGEQPYNVSNDPAVINGTNVFQTLFSWQVASGNLSLGVQYKDQVPCNGDLIVKNCTLQTALVAYPVVVDANDTIALDPASTIFDDIISHKINIDFDVREFGPSTLAGYYLALKTKFNSAAHLRWVGAVGYELLTTGSTATQYAQTNVTPTDGFDIGSSCDLTFTDPTMDIIASARELMFRTALAVAAADPTNATFVQTVQGLQSSTPAVYQSQYLYLILAVVFAVAAVIAVTFTFQGYAVLGRDVSLSPLETGRALGAPLLVGNGLDSNSDVKTLVKAVGEQSARYGAVGVAFAEMTQHGAGGESPRWRKEAHTYAADAGSESEATQMRLEIADEKDAQMPRKGWKFAG